MIYLEKVIKNLVFCKMIEKLEIKYIEKTELRRWVEAGGLLDNLRAA